jgi:hypothetical protein
MLMDIPMEDLECHELVVVELYEILTAFTKSIGFFKRGLSSGSLSINRNGYLEEADGLLII